jgi:hypothetical protein
MVARAPLLAPHVIKGMLLAGTLRPLIWGAVAQLGERLGRIEEVVGSSPICSIHGAKLDAIVGPQRITAAYCSTALSCPSLLFCP